MEYPDVLNGPAAPDSVAAPMPDPVKQALDMEAEDFLKRCVQAKVEDLPITFSLQHHPVTVPACLIRFAALSVLFRLDRAHKWQAALKHEWIPQALLDWLGVRGLDELAAETRLEWNPWKLLLDTLTQQVGRLLIEVRQPRPASWIRDTIRRVLVHKDSVQEGGLVMNRRYWKRFLAQGAKPLAGGMGDEVQQRIQWALGQLELAELAPRYWQPVPVLSQDHRDKLQAVMVSDAPERIQALGEAFDAGRFDFLGDVLATTYSTYGRRAYHPVFMWKVVTAMVARGQMDPNTFLKEVEDSNHVRLFLGVMSRAERPSPRRIKGFLTDRLAPVIEQVVLWFNAGLVTQGGLKMGEEFGTDGMEMAAQARAKSDAVRANLKPVLEWLLAEVRGWLKAEGQGDLTDAEREVVMDALRDLDGPKLGSAGRSQSVMLDAIRSALAGEVVTPRAEGADRGLGPPERASPGFLAFAQTLAWAFGEQIKAFGPTYNWDTLYDPECSPRRKYGKIVYGFGLEFVIDLAYGLVWAFAAFAAGESFQPEITDFMLGFQRIHDLGEMRFTSDREFTIASAIHEWEKDGEKPIVHYGPRSGSPAKSKGIFTEGDFEIHDEYAVCPNQKVLNRKPKMYVRGSNHEWRYQACKTDCATCPLRAQCTTGKGPRTLAVNVYREDLARHAARMEADPAVTRDLMARHRSLVEGTVNNLKNHLGAKHAWWKGLAMARLEFGLAIIMLNLLKWHKIRHGELENLKEKRAREASVA